MQPLREQRRLATALASSALACLLVGFGPCPAGTEPAGAAPPAGLHRFCKRPVPDLRRFVAHGPWQTWHPGGAPYQRGDMVDGVRTGPWTVDDDEGMPRERGVYVDGLRSGRWLTWRRSADGVSLPAWQRVLQVDDYVEGQEHGHFAQWTLVQSPRAELLAVPEGEAPLPGYRCRVAEGSFVHGQRDGMWARWQPCGPLRSRDGWRRGVRHGAMERYSARGTLDYRASYFDGLLTGFVERFHHGGALERRIEVRGGVLEGKDAGYFESGQRRLEGAWQAGRRTGTWTVWNEDGTVRVRGTATPSGFVDVEGDDTHPLARLTGAFAGLSLIEHVTAAPRLEP